MDTPRANRHPDRAIAFYFDVISPYAYLAWTQIHALAERHGRAVVARPTLFAALLEAHGTRGPAEVPARRTYVIRDSARIAHRFGVPLAAPPAHPFNPLLALRVASLPMAEDVRRAVIDALFRAVWVTGRGVIDPEVVRAIVVEAGLGRDAIERAAEPDAKARVRTTSEEAIAQGVFGVPTAIVDDQLFWGCDALPHLEAYLAHGDVVSPALMAAWEELPAQAIRPGSLRKR